MLDLHKGARSDERFHLQGGAPVARKTRFGFGYVITWSNIQQEDGTPGTFRSWWFFGGKIHWYQGNTKCDGTRTRMYWYGQLDDGKEPPYVPDPLMYVMTTTPKEKLAVRFNQTPSAPTWDAMGGA